MSKVQVAGRDFRVTVKDRGAAVTVLAIHGGTIEPFTEKLAEASAGKELNLYVFESLISPREKLHVTATHFDDPRAVALVKASDHCISFHGQKGDDEELVCVGGSHSALAAKFGSAIAREFSEMKVEFPCTRLPGVQPGNIGNRCRRGGVQLELSMKLLRHLSQDSSRAARFTRVIRAQLERNALFVPLSQ